VTWTTDGRAPFGTISVDEGLLERPLRVDGVSRFQSPRLVASKVTGMPKIGVRSTSSRK